jgi:hypothetical protein
MEYIPRWAWILAGVVAVAVIVILYAIYGLPSGG